MAATCWMFVWERYRWLDAEAHCASLGAHLLRLQTAEKFEIMKEYFINQIAEQLSKYF